MHGPYDHQSLLDPDMQLEILDAFGDLEKDKAACKRIIRPFAISSNNAKNFLEIQKAYRSNSIYIRTGFPRLMLQI